MAFQSIQISKFSGGACPRPPYPLPSRPFGARVIRRRSKNAPILHTKKVGKSNCVAYTQHSTPLHEKITKDPEGYVINKIHDN